MDADSFVKAMHQVIRRFESMGITIQKVLSDNARQFRSQKFLNCCSAGIRKIFTTPYNPQGNPVERVMRDLRDKLRLIFNDPANQSMDHRNWDKLVKEMVFTLNHTPKSEGYTLAEILGQESFAPFRKQKMFPNVRSLECEIRKKISKLVLNTKSLTPTIKIKSNKFNKYSHNESGCVTAYTDAATRGKNESDKCSAIDMWFEQNRPGNRSWALDPPLKNNGAEALAVAMAIVSLVNDKQSKIRIKTDSQYIADLYNEKRLTQQ